MKLNTTLNKLPLIALLSVGLVCSPLAANAADDNHGWRGHNQQDRGNSRYKTDHHSDFRSFGHRDHHSYRHSCRTNNKHGYKKGHHKDGLHGYGSHHADVRHHGRVGHHERHRAFPGSYLGSLAVLFYD